MLRMTKKATKRPPKLSAAERKRWDSIVEQMRERGIDPASRLELVADYVRLCSRIERLTEREEDPLLGNTSVSRAINMAEVERRHLHRALFAGAAEPDPIPTPAEIAEREAYDAWCAFYYHFDGREYRDDAERDAREAELFRLYGEAPMRALIIPQHRPITREWAVEFWDWMDAQRTQ